MLGIVTFVEPDEGPRWSVEQIVFGAIVVLLTVVLLVAIFTSRLVLRDGVLTAKHFYGSRSVGLAEVESVEPGFWLCAGLVLRLQDGTKIRTFVSGAVGNEFWETRAERLGAEVEALAEAARQSPDDLCRELTTVAPRWWTFRRVAIWALLLAGWVVTVIVADWWANREEIGWALEEAGSRGQNYLPVVSLVYWGSVGCVALVRTANAEARE